MEQNKVFVLVHEWQFDCGDCGVDVKVFKDLNNAQENLKYLAKTNEVYWKESFDSNYEKEENDVRVSFWESGEYCYNHEEIIIYEKEVI